MTRQQAYQLMASAVDLLLAYGTPVIGFDGLEGDAGELAIETPAGVRSITVADLSLAEAPQALLARVEGQVRAELRPFEVQCGRGFDGARGTLAIQPGYSAREGWM